jgi:iron complex outermembrane recepter protein
VNNAKFSLYRRALYASTVLVAAATTAGSALAQEQDAADDVAEETIVVTGSRIARSELQASTPIQVVTSASIEQQGSQNIADVLTKMPAVGIGSTRTNSNFSTAANGVATINLRNMGTNRTLVLMNGRRVVSGIGGSSAVDVNNVPTDLLERVEVITGGASAVYGSEAMAGVVNFILKDDFEGIRLRAQAGLSDESDYGTQMIGATAGMNFADGRGNITISGQYDRDEGLRSRNRGISANDIPFRSSYVPQGRFFIGDEGDFTFDANNNVKEGFVNGVDGFNRNAERYISVPVERYLVNSLGHYDFSDSISFFYEAAYAKVKSRSRLEPYAFDNSDAELPDGTILSGLTLDNPFIPQEMLDYANSVGATEIGFLKRFNGIFDRSNRNDREFYRAVAGFRGTIGDGWKWDAYYNRSQTIEKTASETGLRDRLYYALDAIEDPVTGDPICRDVAARADGCVPFNVFGFNSASPEAAAYVTNNGQLSTYKAKIQQEVFAANLTGSLFTLPAGDVGVSAGVERRTEKSREIYDAQTQAGNTLSNALANTIGKYRVFEAYAETIVPIISEQPFFEYLGLEGAVRYGDYTTVGSVWSYKIGGEWAPSKDVRFRAVYSRATRAPNIGELFSGDNQTFPSGLTDPCEGVTATSTGAVDAYCRSIPGIAQQIAANGVFEYDDNRDRQSIEGVDGGNPDLNEETAKTWTLGVVLTPRALPRFTLSIDWFDIRIKNAITLVPRQVTIDECAASGGTSELCDLIVREDVGTPRPRTPGTLYQVDSLPVNAASIKTRGIDVAARYGVDIGDSSSLDFALNYTYLDKLTLQPLAGLPVENNRGQLDGDGRLGAGFKHRANFATTFTTGVFSLNWRMNYLSKIVDTLGGGLLPPEQNSVGAYLYHDAQARIALNEARTFEFYFGIDNVFDKKPPLINQNGASNITGTETAADTYDPYGRRFYAGAVVKF